ncbi:unnamed protein product [Amoebophrya sp. A120]|nr:unnamed protein product [Amoebophrya sp. A120]|eukprot:GSA120T00020131001.1
MALVVSSSSPSVARTMNSPDKNADCGGTGPLRCIIVLDLSGDEICRFSPAPTDDEADDFTVSIGDIRRRVAALKLLPPEHIGVVNPRTSALYTNDEEEIVVEAVAARPSSKATGTTTSTSVAADAKSLGLSTRGRNNKGLVQALDRDDPLGSGVGVEIANANYAASGSSSDVAHPNPAKRRRLDDEKQHDEPALRRTSAGVAVIRQGSEKIDDHEEPLFKDGEDVSENKSGTNEVVVVDRPPMLVERDGAGLLGNSDDGDDLPSDHAFSVCADEEEKDIQPGASTPALTLHAIIDQRKVEAWEAAKNFVNTKGRGTSLEEDWERLVLGEFLSVHGDVARSDRATMKALLDSICVELNLATGEPTDGNGLPERQQRAQECCWDVFDAASEELQRTEEFVAHGTQYGGIFFFSEDWLHEDLRDNERIATLMVRSHEKFYRELVSDRLKTDPNIILETFMAALSLGHGNAVPGDTDEAVQENLFNEWSTLFTNKLGGPEAQQLGWDAAAKKWDLRRHLCKYVAHDILRHYGHLMHGAGVLGNLIWGVKSNKDCVCSFFANGLKQLGAGDWLQDAFDHAEDDEVTPPTLLSDKNFIMDDLLPYLCSSWRMAREFLRSSSGTRFRRDREFMLELVRAHPDAFELASFALQNDKEFWRVALVAKADSLGHGDVFASQLVSNTCTGAELLGREDAVQTAIAEGQLLSLLRAGKKWLFEGKDQQSQTTHQNDEQPREERQPAEVPDKEFLLDLYARCPMLFAQDAAASSNLLWLSNKGGGTDDDEVDEHYATTTQSNDIKTAASVDQAASSAGTTTTTTTGLFLKRHEAAIHAFGPVARVALACRKGSCEGLDAHLLRFCRGLLPEQTKPMMDWFVDRDFNFWPDPRWREKLAYSKRLSPASSPSLDGVPDCLRATKAEEDEWLACYKRDSTEPWPQPRAEREARANRIKAERYVEFHPVDELREMVARGKFTFLESILRMFGQRPAKENEPAQRDRDDEQNQEPAAEEERNTTSAGRGDDETNIATTTTTNAQHGGAQNSQVTVNKTTEETTDKENDKNQGPRGTSSMKKVPRASAQLAPCSQREFARPFQEAGHLLVSHGGGAGAKSPQEISLAFRLIYKVLQETNWKKATFALSRQLEGVDHGSSTKQGESAPETTGAAAAAPTGTISVPTEAPSSNNSQGGRDVSGSALARTEREQNTGGPKTTGDDNAGSPAVVAQIKVENDNGQQGNVNTSMSAPTPAANISVDTFLVLKVNDDDPGELFAEEILRSDVDFFADLLYGGHALGEAFTKIALNSTGASTTGAAAGNINPGGPPARKFVVAAASVLGFSCFPHLSQEDRRRKDVLVAAASLTPEKQFGWGWDTRFLRPILGTTFPITGMEFVAYIRTLANDAEHHILKLIQSREMDEEESLTVLAALGCVIPYKLWSLLPEDARKNLSPSLRRKFCRAIATVSSQRIWRGEEPGGDPESGEFQPLLAFWSSLSLAERENDPLLLQCLAESADEMVHAEVFAMLKPDMRVRAVLAGPKLAGHLFDSPFATALLPPDTQFDPAFWLDALRALTTEEQHSRNISFKWCLIPWALRRNADFMRSAAKINPLFVARLAGAEVLASKDFVLEVLRIIPVEACAIFRKEAGSRCGRDVAARDVKPKKFYQSKAEQKALYLAESLRKAVEKLLLGTTRANCNNEELVEEAVKRNGQVIRYASWRLRSDKRIAKTAVEQDGAALKQLPHHLAQDEDICLAAVSQCGLALKYCPMKLRRESRAIVLAAVRNDPDAVCFVRGEKLLGAGDPEIYQASLKSRVLTDYLLPWHATTRGGGQRLSEDHPLASRRSEFLYEAALAGNTDALTLLDYDDRALLNNYDRMSRLVAVDGEALAYTPLRGKFDLAMTAVKNTGAALRHVCPTLLRSAKEGKQLVLAALQSERGRQSAVAAVPRTHLRDPEIRGVLEKLNEEREEKLPPFFNAEDFRGVAFTGFLGDETASAQGAGQAK